MTLRRIGAWLAAAVVVLGLGTPWIQAAGVRVSPISVAVGAITGLGSNVATWLATPSSANLIAALTDETGTGAAVFANTPTLVTPVLGAATATTINGVTLDNTAWTTYTPTVTCAVGSITSGTPTGFFKQIGKLLFVRVAEVIATIGTCTGNMTFTAPSPGTPLNSLNWPGAGYNQSTGVSFPFAANATGLVLVIVAPTTNTYVGTVFYEVA